MIRVKKGVVFKAFRVEMLFLFDALYDTSETFGTDIWITSANDSKHRDDSYHFINLAIDIRIRNLSNAIIQYIIKTKCELEDSEYYDFVLEKDHIHIEFDERRYERERGDGSL